ncbi:MAG: DNA primase [Oscillospiraceae bacterium]|nr:DNA primase [Oscillospiraceae bacterium]
MAFSPVFLDELIDRNPIEDVVGQSVSLTRRGANLFGLCPFHSEKTPSFSVAPEKGIFYCFGCHKGGGVINFIMEQESLDFPDAVRYLAKRAGMDMPEDSQNSTYLRQERLWRLSKDAARYFHTCFKAEIGKPGRDYVNQRGLSPQTVARFGIGYAPDSWSGLIDAMGKLGYEKLDLIDAGLAIKGQKDGSIYDRFRGRLMFPIIDIRGNVIGFGGRVLGDGTPKYLNSPETLIFNKRKNLFALNVARKSKRGMLILCEGYMDAITLHQYGFDCAVASLGTSLTDEHANLIAKYTDQVVLIYDGDEAGQNATRRAIPMLERTGVRVKVLRMEGAKDPDEFLKKFGADRFQLLLEKSESHVEYRLDALRRKYDLSIDEQKISFTKDAIGLVSGLGTAVEREIYAGRVAETVGVAEQAVRFEVDKARKRRLAAAKKKQTQQAMDPAKLLQPAIKGEHYANLRSAMAEEGLLRMALTESAMLSRASALQSSQFSSPLLGRAFDALRQLYQSGLGVTLAALGGSFSPEEMRHLTAIARREDVRVSDEATDDYVRIITEESEKASAHTEQDILALRDRFQKTKGYGGK